ncbi:MAG: hypothetical protein PHG85_06760 [Candidatus Altiarchaeota archaeon]|nr:hypothetical protein [Candidatus Altiarchaeota archaeon]
MAEKKKNFISKLLDGMDKKLDEKSQEGCSCSCCTPDSKGKKKGCCG